MDNNNFLTELWKQQNTGSLPDINTLKMEILKQKKNRQKKLLVQNVMLGFTIAFLIFVGMYSNIGATALLGIACLGIASVAFIAANSSIINLFKKANAETNGKEYLSSLATEKELHFRIQKVLLNIYFALLTIGLCLSMIDYTHSSPNATLIYALAFLWILYTYFYVRPRKVARQKKEYESVLHNIDRIQSQYH